MKYLKLYDNINWEFDDEESERLDIEPDDIEEGLILYARDNFYMCGEQYHHCQEQFLIKDKGYEILLYKEWMEGGDDIIISSEIDDNHYFRSDSINEFFYIK